MAGVCVWALSPLCKETVTVNLLLLLTGRWRTCGLPLMQRVRAGNVQRGWRDGRHLSVPAWTQRDIVRTGHSAKSLSGQQVGTKQYAIHFLHPFSVSLENTYYATIKTKSRVAMFHLHIPRSRDSNTEWPLWDGCLLPCRRCVFK